MNALSLICKDDPLIGLRVRLPDVCKCGANLPAIIGPGRGPHRAELLCTICSRHRGWMPNLSAVFLLETIRFFGRPTEPIAITRDRQRAAECGPSKHKHKESSHEI